MDAAEWNLMLILPPGCAGLHLDPTTVQLLDGRWVS
jgi:hypothetical protein